MIELLTTRHNPLVDPTLHVWEWQIRVYLFLGGLVVPQTTASARRFR